MPNCVSLTEISCEFVQEVGEHAHCGRGILPASGFSYDPEAFMAADIGVYNFSWRDMGVPTLFKIMDIVQVKPNMQLQRMDLVHRTVYVAGLSQSLLQGTLLFAVTCAGQQACSPLSLRFHCLPLPDSLSGTDLSCRT